MKRGRRRVLLPLLLLGSLVAFTGYLASQPLQPLTGAPVAGTPVPPAPVPPDPQPSKEPVPPPQAEPLPSAPPPRSPFVARLLVGDGLMRLRNGDERCSLAELRQRLEAITPDLLDLDGRLPPDPQDALEFLTKPRRDTGVLRLANRARAPLGDDLLIRVWTLGEAYPPPPIARAETMLHQLAAVSGTSLARGFDVAVTPRASYDLFPLGPDSPYMLGVYFRAARLCAVRSTIGGRLGDAALRHELVHGFHGTFPNEFTTSRCVSEGLAEYLRYIRPGEKGLDIPALRFADNLALLDHVLAVLETWGFDFRRISPRRLVSMDASSFYALPIAYLLAQSMIAYVGGKVVEEAYRAGDDRPLVQALAAIDWEAFRAFLRQYAPEGDPTAAVSVREPPPEDTVLFSEFDAWRELGASHVRRDPTPPDPLAEEDHVKDVLARLLAGGADLFVVSFRSPAMEEVHSAIRVPAEYFAPLSAELRATTGRDFVASLPSVCERITRKGVLRMQPGAEPGAADATRERSFPEVSLVNNLVALDRREPLLILCMADPPPDPGMAKRVRDFAAAVATSGFRPRAALVIDLSVEGGFALPLARVLARDGFSTSVAYWRPERE